jgi:hypothetical protein
MYRATFDYCLKLGGNRDQGLVAYSDANWASYTSDRRSTSGGLFQFGGSTINCFSRKQSCVTLSSIEAEYYALADKILEVIWLRQLLEEFGEEQNSPSVIKLANSELENVQSTLQPNFNLSKKMLKKM